MLKLNQIYMGDCAIVMREIDSNSIDTIITDPPYALEFLNLNWDKVLPDKTVWYECLRVAKPGALLLAFGGTRTFHRLTCNIEDAGWKIKDCMLWLYASGFPKSKNISKGIDEQFGLEKDRKPISSQAQLWDGWGTGLAPAWEPIIVAMKSVDSNYVNNALQCRVGGLNIDGGRIGNEIIKEYISGKNALYGSLRGGDNSYSGHTSAAHRGRWPKNVILDEEAVKLLDKQTGQNISRFFYCAKASKSERNLGLNGICTHPTVKPTRLLDYLCKLTKTPTGGIVLDPFAGSGTTGIACQKINRPFIIIEKEEKWCKIAQQRLNYYKLRKKIRKRRIK